MDTALEPPGPIVSQSASALARAIQSGELTASEVLEAHLKRIDQVNPKVNAVIARDDALARERAAQADRALARGESWGPLHGVPFTIKDVFATRAMVTTYGMPHLTHHRPKQNAAVVDRLQAAGAILMGKTNLPFASYDWQSRHPRLGRCNNPHDLARTPGGSSGGTAAALAAHLTPVDVGSDLAGSIRVPCHFCGVWGLRPTEGFIPDAGHGSVPNMRGQIHHMVTVGPMARTSEDMQLGMQVLAGLEPRNAAPLPPEGLNIAWSGHFGGVVPVSSVQAVIGAYRQSLVKCNARLTHAAPEVNPQELVALWGHINGHEMGQILPRAATLPVLGRAVGLGYFRGRLGPGNMPLALRQGFTASQRDFERWLAQREELGAHVDRFFEQFDAWILPVAPFPAFQHQRTGAPISVANHRFAYADALATYNCSLSVLGQPVVAMPIGTTPQGLPVSVQVVGPRGSDARLVRIARGLAGALQNARGDRAPLN
mgnify:CR=1 FL=1